jgi:hypothetical protein
MKAKELGKSYLVVFCKGCGAGFRVQENPVPEGAKVQIAKAQQLKCPSCAHKGEYQPAEIRVAKYQKEGLGKRRGARP